MRPTEPAHEPPRVPERTVRHAPVGGRTAGRGRRVGAAADGAFARLSRAQTDACAGGACTGGNPLDCDDGNLCTEQACDAIAGCLYESNAELCAEPYCAGGVLYDVAICADSACPAQVGTPCGANSTCGIENDAPACVCLAGFVKDPLTGACVTDIIQYGTSTYDHGYAVKVDPRGNAYVTGSTWGALDGEVGSGLDLFLTRFGPDRTRLWTRLAGTMYGEWGKALDFDTAGNIYVAGYCQRLPVPGFHHVYLAKFSPDGTLSWTKEWASQEKKQEQATGIVVTPANEIFITGYTEGVLPGGASLGFQDAFLAKFTTDGDWVWTRHVGTNQTDYGAAIARDPATGMPYLTGFTHGGMFGRTTTLGLTDVFVAKYSPAGLLQWGRQVGTNKFDYALGLSLDGLGNVLVSGRTQGNLGGTNRGIFDMYVYKWDANGSPKWVRQRGTAGNEAAYVATDALGNVYLTSYVATSLDGQPWSGGYDIAVVKYDAGGVWKWTKQWGTPLNEEPYGIGLGATVDQTGQIFVTGYTSGTLGQTSAGAEDIFLLIYKDPQL